MSHTIAAETIYTENARLVPPKSATPRTTGITAGELYYDSINQQLLVGFDPTTMDEIVMELSNSTGIDLTGTNGRFTVQVDTTVLRETGTYNVSSTIGMGSGRLVIPQGTAYPASPNEGDIFWRTDLEGAFVYSSGSGWVDIGGVTGAVTSVSAGLGLTGGGVGAVTIDVGSGDGIDVLSNNIAINLASTNPGLEFDTGALQVQIDGTTAPGSNIASVIGVGTSGIHLQVDDATLEADGAGGLLQLKAAGIQGSHLSANAMQTVLESKTSPGYLLVNRVDMVSGLGRVSASAELRALLTTDTPVTSLTTEGAYVGFSEEVWSRIRVSDSHNPVLYGNNEVFGRLSSRGFMKEDTVISGVTILAMSAGVPDAGTLTFTVGPNELSWNGGSAVNVGSSGTPAYFKIVGSGVDDYIMVKVIGSSLPVGGTSSVLRVAKYHTSTQPTNITGVEVQAAGAGAVSGATLAFTFTGTLLAWNGGATQNVGAGGTFTLVGTGGADDLLRVVVTSGSLPGSDQSDTVPVDENYYELALSIWNSDVEEPFEATSTTEIDFLAMEVFDLYSITPESVLVANSFTNLSGSGGGGAGTYVHTQAGALATWTITHNLGTFDLAYTLYDSSGQPLSANNTNNPDANTMEFTFLAAQTGKAVLVGA